MDYQNDGWLVSISLPFYLEGKHKAMERKEYIWPSNFSGICPVFFLNTFLNYRRGVFTAAPGNMFVRFYYLASLVNERAKFYM